MHSGRANPPNLKTNYILLILNHAFLYNVNFFIDIFNICTHTHYKEVENTILQKTKENDCKNL